MKERIDFRLARLENRVFGTRTPTAGTAGGATLNTADMITRIVDLENQLATASTHTEGSGAPSDEVGKNGDTYWDSTNLMAYRKLGDTWRMLAS